jgi:type IV secretory pathway TrbD component
MKQVQEQELIFERIPEEEVRAELKEMARWTNILAIVGWLALSVMSLLFLMFLFGGSLSALLSGADLSAQLISGLLASLVILGTYWYPTLLLHRFSRQMRRGFDRDDPSLVLLAVRNLKRFFKFTAILVLIFILLYLLIVLFDAFLLLG